MDFVNVNNVKIAVEGCCHGELDKTYESIKLFERRNDAKVDLLLICGDFQGVCNNHDLECVAMPAKYRKLNTFHQYVNGEKRAYVTTIFIGGNHEASNILQSLYYGGYAAPNIFFLGFAGVIRFRGLRIGGLSGIFNGKHYRAGRFEHPPYTPDTVRSIYHVRELEVYRMAHFSEGALDVFLSHDWPNGIWEHGSLPELLRKKPFLRDDIVSNRLGSPPAMHLLRSIKPRFWFSGHMHVRFEATVVHSSGAATGDVADENAGYDPESDSFVDPLPVPCQNTYFLALDKVIPGRQFMEILDVPVVPSSSLTQRLADESNEIRFDPEWLAVVRRTHRLVENTSRNVHMPAAVQRVTEEELRETTDLLITEFGSSLAIPHITPRPLPVSNMYNRHQVEVQVGDAQTDRLLRALGLEHRWTVPFAAGGLCRVVADRPPLPPMPPPQSLAMMQQPAATTSAVPLSVAPDEGVVNEWGYKMNSATSNNSSNSSGRQPMFLPPPMSSEKAGPVDPNDIDIDDL